MFCDVIVVYLLLLGYVVGELHCSGDKRFDRFYPSIYVWYDTVWYIIFVPTKFHGALFSVWSVTLKIVPHCSRISHGEMVATTRDGVGTDKAEDSDALACLFLAATMSIYV